MHLDKLKLIRGKLGASVVEIVVAVAIFMLVAPTIIVMVLGSHTANLRAEKRLVAEGFAQQGLEAARSIRDYDWSNLGAGDHGLSNVNGYWELDGVVDDDLDGGNFERVLSVVDVNAYTKDVAVVVSWELLGSLNNSVAMSTRLTNWAILAFVQTSLEDFDAGEHNSVETEDVGGGEVVLDVVGSWAEESVFLTENLDGSGDVRDIFIDRNSLFVVAEDDAGDPELWFYDISNVDGGEVVLKDSLDLLEDVNGIAVSGGYMYLATAGDLQEVVIVDLGDFSVVNSIDILGTSDGLSVAVANNLLFVGTEDNGLEDEFIVYDVSDPEAVVIAEVDSLNVGEDVNEVVVSGDYVYLAVDDGDDELVVYGVGAGAEVNSLNISGNTEGLALFVLEDVLYLGSRQNGGGREEFLEIDISDPEGVLTILNEVEINEDVNDIFVENGLAYLATDDANDNEVMVVDLSDYTIEAEIDLNGNSDAGAIWFKGKYIYVGSADNSNTLQILESGEVAGWANASLLDSDDIDENFDANDIYLEGDYAYLVTDNNGGGGDAEFYIYDISNPASVVLVGQYDVGDDVKGVYVVNDVAYLATDDNDAEVVVLDVSNKVSPLFVGSYDAADNENGLSVFVQGDELFLGRDEGDEEEFLKLDVSDPGAISLVSGFEVGNDVNGIVVSGDSAYLATDDNDAELLILNIGGMDIYEEDAYDLASDPNANGIYLEGNTAYLVTDDDGGTDDFYIFDVENDVVPMEDWSDPQLQGLFDSDEGVNANEVYVEGDYAYLVTENNSGFLDGELHIVDISDESSPSLVSSLDIGSSVNDVHVVGDVAYLATDDNSKELVVVDVSNKAFPVEVGSYNSDEGRDGYSVFNVGNVVYLGTDNNTGAGDVEFYALDVSNLLSISLLGSYDVTNDVNDIIVEGDYAYLASDDNATEFLVLDVSSLASISEADRYNMASNPNAEGLALVGDYLYVTTNDDGGTDDFYIFDVSDPENVSLESSLNLGSTNNNVDVNGDFAYVATNTNNEALKVLDVSNVAAPVEIGSFNVGADANGVMFSGDYVYLATEDNDGEIHILGAMVTLPDFIELLGAVDLDSDNNDVVVAGDFAYVATDDGAEGLTIVDISNAASPAEFGVFDAEDAVNGVAFDGVYVYLATAEDNKEFQVIGESTAMTKYALWGVFTSEPFDSGSGTTNYSSVSWSESGVGVVKLQVRTASSEVGLEDALWVGENGDGESYYEVSGAGVDVDPQASGTRWLQYRVFLESSDGGNSSPVFEDITIEYN